MSILHTGIIMGMGSANERQCYSITLSLIDGAHTQDDPFAPSMDMENLFVSSLRQFGK